MKWTEFVEAAVAEVVDWTSSVVVEIVRHLVEDVTLRLHQWTATTATDALALWPVDRCAVAPCYCYPNTPSASMSYHQLA
jgi:hypothetical protein